MSRHLSLVAILAIVLVLLAWVADVVQSATATTGGIF